jgi:putative FmdB family regulatory protein
MPIYEYACGSCHAKFERLVKSMSGQEPAACPKCGSTKTIRSLSVFAVGGETAGKSSPPPGICGRCGQPGPCANN